MEVKLAKIGLRVEDQLGISADPFYDRDNIKYSENKMKLYKEGKLNLEHLLLEDVRYEKQLMRGDPSLRHLKNNLISSKKFI